MKKTRLKNGQGTRAIYICLLCTVGLILASIAQAALEGPVSDMPGSFTRTWDGSQAVGPSEDGNMARDNTDGWWVVGDDGVHPQGTIGKTIWIEGVSIADSTDVYWGPADPTAVALAFHPGSYTSGDIMTFSAGSSSLASGILRFTGSTTIQIRSGSTWVTQGRTTRWTLTVTDAITGSPVGLASAGSVGLPSGIGGVVPIASSSSKYKMHALFEVLYNSNWMPAYNHYNQQETRYVTAGAQYTFNEGLFYEQPAIEAVLFESVTPTVLGITWNNLLAGASYSVRSKTNLLQATWNPEVGFTPDSSTRVTYHNYGGIPKKYYRLVQLP